MSSRTEHPSSCIRVGPSPHQQSTDRSGSPSARLAASLVPTAGNMALGFTGVASSMTTPLSIVQTLAFSPATYGAPILEGVMQSMCAA
ncbi:hypothetical protein [Nocardia xishanensis]